MSQIIGVPRQVPNQLSPNSTTETVFRDANATGSPLLLDLPSAGALAAAAGRGSALFKVRAWGRVVTDATTNFTISLYYGTSVTVANNTLLEQSTAVAVNTLSRYWMIEAYLIWDSVSNRLSGVGHSVVADTYAVFAAVNNVATSADPDGNAAQGFVLSGTWSVASAGHTANVDGFVLEKGW